MEWYNVFLLAFSFFVLLALGVPISMSIGLSTILVMFLSMPALPAVATAAQRMAVGLDSFALLAVPFFILAGQFMNRGGIARRLIDFAKVLVGPLPGGLAVVNIISGMLFGAISGSAVAAAAAIGGFMAPLMKKEGYGVEYSAAANITSATTGLVIPPSNILIVYSLASGGVSIAALFIAGYLPGILVGFAVATVAGIIAWRNGYPVAKTTSFKDSMRRLWDAVPSLFMIVLVIGGIVGGYFTATEASAIAVLYTFILSVMIYKEVQLKQLPEILLETSQTTAIIMLLIATSMGMSWMMSYENIPQTISQALVSLSDNKFTILMIINIILLVVGSFMDMTPAVLIFTPIFLPVVQALGVDPVHFGIIMVVNLSIGICTPPVGSVLFVGCSVAGIDIARVVRPILPFYFAMLVALIAITYFPWLALTLPKMFGY